MAPTTVGDYAILPLTVPATSPAFPKPTTHYLYIRPHQPASETATAPAARSLFVSNVPADADLASVRALFAQAALGGAKVAAVEFGGEATTRRGKGAAVAVQSSALQQQGESARGKKRKRGSAKEVKEEDLLAEQARLPDVWEGCGRVGMSGEGAVVVFLDEATREGVWRCVRKACRAKGEERAVWRGGEGLGVARYAKHHQQTFPDLATLKASVSAYLSTFTALEAARAKALARQRSVPDADGFVTVTRGARAGPARVEEAQAQAEKLKEKHKGKEDFYRFQIREKRKERETELRRQFEEDRRKVLEMRERRGGAKPM